MKTCPTLHPSLKIPANLRARVQQPSQLRTSSTSLPLPFTGSWLPTMQQIWFTALMISSWLAHLDNPPVVSQRKPCLECARGWGSQLPWQAERSSDHHHIPWHHHQHHTPTAAVTTRQAARNDPLIKSRLGKHKTMTRDLLSLIGKLSFAAKVVPSGRLFLRRRIELSSTVSKLHHHIHLNVEAREDIIWWNRFLPSWNGVSVFLDPNWKDAEAINLFTDASGTLGYGAYFNGAWFRSDYDFCSTHHWKPLPGTAWTLALFVTDLSMNLQPGTIQVYISAGSFLKNCSPLVSNLHTFSHSCSAQWSRQFHNICTLAYPIIFY